MMKICIIHKQIPPRPATVTEENIKKIKSLAEDIEVILCETEDELIEKCPDAEILICWGIDCPKRWVSGAKSLKWIQSFTAGTEALQPIKEMRPDVIVTKMTGVHAYPMADTFRFFGMKVLGCRRTPRPEDRADKMYSLDEIGTMLPLCDFVVSLVPASPQADKLFNEQRFASFKDGAYFISMGRGIAVDEDALVKALESGKLGGAAMDVFRKEPLPADSPLWDMENVIITPHCSATTAHSFDRSTETFCKNFKKFTEGTLKSS